ncbi:MAG: SAP domain-containing protein, partial [Candidatus Thermoplasmatota archaeon]|nr:SAP domain-containing protein [Candidatus Thermoplasmatota archaeon]
MPSEEIPDRNILLAMKLSELRQLCNDHGFLVSGKKHELVDRLLGIETPSVPTPETVVQGVSEDIDDAIDRLIARVSGDEPAELEPEPEAIPEPEIIPEPELEEEVIEAEIVEAEIAEPEEPDLKEDPEPVEEDPWFSGVIPSEVTDEVFLDEDKDEEPSIIITLPSVEGLRDNWQAVSAIAVVVLLVGAIAFYL